MTPEDKKAEMRRLCNKSYEELLKELLAVIHQDGGHHTDNVGIVQSVVDAMEQWWYRGGNS